jgi:hypothetical protein
MSLPHSGPHDLVVVGRACGPAPDALALAFARRAEALGEFGFGTGPMDLAAGGLALALIAAADALGDPGEALLRCA